MTRKLVRQISRRKHFQDGATAQAKVLRQNKLVELKKKSKVIVDKDGNRTR